MQTNIGLFLDKRARLEPNKVGLIFEGREITFAQWNERANRAANAFIALGVKPGDRVGLLMTNSVEFLECFFGLARIGAIVVPLNWRLAPPEIASLANDAGLGLLIYDSEFLPAVDAARGDLRVKSCIVVGAKVGADDGSYAELLEQASTDQAPTAGGGDDPLVIMFTSGTTGRQKGAVLTHNNLFYDACTVSHSLDWRTTDRVLVAMPLFHIGALIYTVIDVHIGSTTVLMRAFDPGAYLKTVQEHQVTSLLAVPAMLSFMLQSPAFKDADLSSVRCVLCGAAPVPVPLIQAWAQRGIAIQQVYGLTECAGGAAVLGPQRAIEKVGSTGLAMFHTDIRVLNDQGDDVGVGEVGEIAIRGPHVMREYWNNPQATAETVKNGWLYTGDLGRFDKEGYLYIVERKKDMIISGGENIYPAEIESVLSGLAQIAEVAVIGVADRDWGEAVCAVARLKEGQALTLDQVAAHCAGKLGKYKIPKKLVITDVPLPRSPVGKVLKQVLRTQVVA